MQFVAIFQCADQYHKNVYILDAQFDETIDQQTTEETAEKRLLEMRNKDNGNVLICHQNINSIQTTIEDLRELNKSLSAQITFVTETKLDSTYPAGVDPWGAGGAIPPPQNAKISHREKLR